MCDLHRLKSQATVTFFPVQGLENNVAYWTSFGVAEAEPSMSHFFIFIYFCVAMKLLWCQVFHGFRGCEQYITAIGSNLCVASGEGLDQWPLGFSSSSGAVVI